MYGGKRARIFLVWIGCYFNSNSLAAEKRNPKRRFILEGLCYFPYNLFLSLLFCKMTLSWMYPFNRGLEIQLCVYQPSSTFHNQQDYWYNALYKWKLSSWSRNMKLSHFHEGWWNRNNRTGYSLILTITFTLF